MKLGVFIERDGVLNQAQVERQHQVSPRSVDKFRVHTSAAPFIQKLREAGFVVIITTNQPGISRGYLPRNDVDLMHRILRKALVVDDLMMCPHDETDDCPCRKPRPGLLKEAAFTWHLDLERSYVVSDKWQDAEAALRVGCTSLMIDSPWLSGTHHDLVLPNFPAVVKKILQLKTVTGPVYA